MPGILARQYSPTRQHPRTSPRLKRNHHYSCRPRTQHHSHRQQRNPPPPPPRLAQIEAEHIAAVLSHHQGNRSASARTLGISRPTLLRKITEYGLENL
ncbi:MAG: hypothetical protein EA402_04500 [Planctomycetota bacterium]|nr:MAG: hypothetical protein EA402_04500 [Planctomycetota bacterium]